MKNCSVNIDSTASVRKHLREWRLQTASVILGNLAYMHGDQGDISQYHAISELCEQYCSSILLNWLAIKLGFPVCRSAIEKDIPGGISPLLTWPVLSKTYPLYFDSIIRDTESLWKSSFEHFEKTLPVRLDVVGSLHEDQLAAPLKFDSDLNPYIEDDHTQRLAGQFYTPASVVRYCLDRAFGDDGGALLSRLEDCLSSGDVESSEFQIIDPACGTGNFLVGTVDWLLAHGASEADLVAVASSVLSGRDLDGRAVSLARFCVLLSCSRYLNSLHPKDIEQTLARLWRRITLNIRVGDAVIEWCHAADGNFDLIIGNPPYVSYGARNQLAIEPEWQQFLKRKFPQAAEYKVRLHSIFQDISVRAAKPGGHVVLLLPDAFLTGSYYGKLRQLLIERCDILSLSDLPPDTVPGAVVGRWCVPHYRKKANAAPADAVTLFRLESSSNLSCPQGFELSRQLLVSKDRSRFQLVFKKEDAEILDVLRSLAPLSGMLRGHTGIRARAGQSSIIAEKKESGTFKKGLVSGGQVSPYAVEWRGHWLDIDKSKLYAGGFSKDVIENPKILIRQTGDTIIAAIDEDRFYHLNNVHSFSAQELDSNDIWYLLALLNSSFYRFVYFLKSREEKKALAQIDIEMVECMPLPDVTAAQRAQLAEAAKQLTSNAKRKEPLEPLRFECDRLVYEAFSLTPTQADYISANLGKR